MKKVILGSLMILASLAQAEVKPTGTILETECGTVNKSYDVCTAITQDTNNDYLVLKGFAYRNSALKGAYYPAQVSYESTNAFSETIYVAKVPTLVGNYIVEKEYKLVTKTYNFATVQPTTVLYVDGKPVSGNISMETIYHTQSL
jgi:hypothetical protein